MKLKFQIKKQKLKRLDSEKPAQKSINFLNSSFFFDDSWNNIVKKAIFKVNGKIYTKQIINGECLIPWEVLSNNGFLLSVFGTKTNEDFMITTNEIFINLEETNYPDKIEKQSPPPPLPPFLQEELEC